MMKLQNHAQFVMKVSRDISKAKRKPASPVERIKGITDDSKELGVTRWHLFAVLTGRRESKSLLQRYKLLKKRQREEEKARIAA